MSPYPEFTVEEFNGACAELDHRSVESYELFVDSHDVTIYRQYEKSSGLYRYKIYGLIRDVSPDVCAKVYMDLDYRKIWDSYVHTLTDFQIDDRAGIYWQVNFPFPLANRDYTYVREFKQIKHCDRDVSVILAKSADFPLYPPQPGIVRVSEYQQSLAITVADDDDQSTKAFMNYYDNPGGLIPSWFINWAASKGVPSFLNQMQKACLQYMDYYSSRSSSSVSSSFKCL